MPRSRTLALWAALLTASALLGYLLALARFPAALLLGPMLCAVAFATRGAPLRVPRPLFQAAQAVIGCLVAGAVNRAFLDTLAGHGPLMLAVVLVTVAAGALVGAVLTRFQVLPGTTAAWGSSPGGAAAMVMLAEAYGSDPRLVAFMQYLRVALVVLSASVVARLLVDGAASGAAGPAPGPDAPASLAATLAVAVLGAGAGRLLRLPAGVLIGPMLLGAGLHAAGLVRMDLPGPLLDAAYAVIGWYVGLRFTRQTLRTSLHALPGVLAATVLMILLCGAWAWGLTRLMSIDFLTAFLATSPGGLDSVAIIALGAHVDVPFVLGVQTLRLLTVLATGPLLARWIARAAPAGSDRSA